MSNKIVCEICDSIISKKGLKKHQKTKKCLKKLEKMNKRPIWKDLYNKFEKAFFEGEVGTMITIYNKFNEIKRKKKWEREKCWEFMDMIGKLKKKYKGVEDAISIFNVFEKMAKNVPPLITRN